ncbi:MAG: hypothetical protein ABH881_02765 [bacterium]
MRWINFLHCYQPANSSAQMIEEATEKSYMRIVRALEEHDNIKFNMNINGCLFLRWEELGYGDLIKRIKNLVEKKKIELTGTACYHPLLPLVPKEEIEAQIEENETILKKHFGKDFKPFGFFLPEMAYSKEAARVIRKKGYKWIILDEIAYDGRLNQPPNNKIYLDKASGLKVIFRQRALSNKYVPEAILKQLEEDEDNLAITATDGELYGFRHMDHTAEFEKLLKNKNLRTELISDFISDNEDREIKIVPCSWESTEEDLQDGQPYALWINSKNQIQKKLWQLAELAYREVDAHRADKNYDWARWHLSRGLASCTFWWASERDFRKTFGPLAWNPDEIERGANDLLRAIRSLDEKSTLSAKVQAEKIFADMLEKIWEKHWTRYWRVV